MQNEKKRTWAEIKMISIQYNLNKIRGIIPKECKVCGVVKANAYGHGAVQVAKTLEEYGCNYLAVATIEEAEQLRAAEIALPILILSHTPAEFVGRVVAADCIQALGSKDAVNDYSRVLEKEGLKLRVHIKLETGMGRTGFDVKNGDVDCVVEAMTLPCFESEGIFTHFASADDPSQKQYTLRQFELFCAAVDEIEKKSGKKFALKHCANSAVMISYPQMCLDMVRVGISLYGVHPGEDTSGIKLTPAMELRSRIAQISELEPGDSVSYGRTFTADRKMKVAVLPIGYADGLHRVLSGKLELIIRGRRCRQIGTICMDMCMVDVTSVYDVNVGDAAVIIGSVILESVSVKDIAEKAGTISYEILCGVSPRVPRVYLY